MIRWLVNNATTLLVAIGVQLLVISLLMFMVAYRIKRNHPAQWAALGPNRWFDQLNPLIKSDAYRELGDAKLTKLSRSIVGLRWLCFACILVWFAVMAVAPR